jgi:hypothetical protein
MVSISRRNTSGCRSHQLAILEGVALLLLLVLVERRAGRHVLTGSVAAQ